MSESVRNGDTATGAIGPAEVAGPAPSSESGSAPLVGLLTGGHDRSYAHGLALSLASSGVKIEFIGSDALDGEALRSNNRIRFLNLRGDQSEDASLLTKVLRLSRYYLRLAVYVLRTRARVLHILWNNKFEYFDRTFLMLFYRLCRKRVVMTAHNVNVAKRDGYDSWLNRRTLAIQYRLCSRIFVHTEKMRAELRNDFSVPDDKISVIPFGLNDTSPRTNLTERQARDRLGLESGELVLLFFGQIAPYKGLRYLVDAMPTICRKLPGVRLIIAGKVKRGSEDYWQSIEKDLAGLECEDRISCRIEHIPESDIEVYFKGSDALIVPYAHIFQSGVPFLAYSFGLPVLATDVGSLSEEIVAGETGFVCKPCDGDALTSMITRYAGSNLYKELSLRRRAIADSARERHSWTRVAEISRDAYNAAMQKAAKRPSATGHSGVGTS